MDDLKAAWEALKAKINSCGATGANSERIGEIKDLASDVDSEFEKLDEGKSE